MFYRRIFLAILLTITAIDSFGNSAPSFLPNDVERIRREDLAHAYYHYGENPECGFAVAAFEPGYDNELSLTEKRSEIFAHTLHIDTEMAGQFVALGEQIRGESLDFDSLELLRGLRESGEPPLRGVLADALGFGGLDRAGDHFRYPLPPSPSIDAASATRNFLQLFYYLKLNRAVDVLPPLLVNHGYYARDRILQRWRPATTPLDQIQYRFDPEGLTYAPERYPRHHVYFCEGFFCGAEISFRELMDFENELLATPTLKHLAVRLSRDQVFHLAASPVLDKIETLDLTFVVESEPHTRRRRRRVNTPQTLVNLKKLALRSGVPGQVLASTEVLDYFPAGTIEHLELHDIRPGRTHNRPLLGGLKTFVFSNSGALGNDPEHTPSMCSALNPELNSLSISDRGSLNYLQQHLREGPKFVQLRHLRLETDRPLRAADWSNLADRASIWKKLEIFEVSNSGGETDPGNTALYTQINRALRQTTRLATLHLENRLYYLALREILDGVFPLPLIKF